MANSTKNDLEFRDLTPEDVEVRVAMAKEKGVSLLIYKDARVDQDILDETVGKFNWKKKYEVINDNLYCTISIKDPIANEWIDKMDCGVESNTEKEKGEASDAQKRAGFVWGIGRELYSAPFIWVGSDKCEIVSNQKGGFQCKSSFSVTSMTIEKKKIVGLEIINNKTGEVVYTFGKASKTTTVIVNSEAPAKVEAKATTKTETTSKVTTKKPTLKDALAASYKGKTGKSLTLQQTVDSCKTVDAVNKFKDWLKEQANSKTSEIAEQCKIVYIAVTKGLVKFPVAA